MENLEMSKGAIFVLDNDPAVRETLRIILERGGYEAICFAGGEALLKAVRQRLPVCIFLDVMLPGRSGLEILEDLRRVSVPTIMISGYGDIPIAVKSLKNGAVDFVEKPFSGEEIIRRLEKVIGEHRRTPEAPPLLHDHPGWEVLTSRERDVLEHVVAGHSSKQTGSALRISHRTVEDHRARILRKLGVRNSSELVLTVLGHSQSGVGWSRQIGKFVAALEGSSLGK
jgi:FixJ family two-component response regulator